MAVSAQTSGGFSYWCSTCGKPVVIEPCWPLGDAPCPHCGCLLFLPDWRRANPSALGSYGGSPLLDSINLLPDTEENHQQAEAIARELIQAWEMHKARRTRCGTPETEEESSPS